MYWNVLDLLWFWFLKNHNTSMKVIDSYSDKQSLSKSQKTSQYNWISSHNYWIEPKHNELQTALNFYRLNFELIQTQVCPPNPFEPLQKAQTLNLFSQKQD